MSSHAAVMPRASGRAERTSRTPAVVAGGKGGGGGALGGEPRVSLLPAEVDDLQKAKAIRRRLGLGVVFVVLIVLAGVAGAYYFSTVATAQLATAQATQAALLNEDLEFSDLRTAKKGMDLIEAGQYVGAATEIDWKTYLESLQGTLPDGVLINSVTIDSATPFADYAQSAVPLEGSRIATLVFTAMSPGLPSIPNWLDGLGTLTGFADAVPGSVTVQSDGSYLVNITMHINGEAFAHRFPGEDVK